jgi:hypothetical protein
MTNYRPWRNGDSYRFSSFGERGKEDESSSEDGNFDIIEEADEY